MSLYVTVERIDLKTQSSNDSPHSPLSPNRQLCVLLKHGVHFLGGQKQNHHVVRRYIPSEVLKRLAETSVPHIKKSGKCVNFLSFILFFDFTYFLFRACFSLIES